MSPHEHRWRNRLAVTLSFAAFILACIFGVFGLYAAKLEAQTVGAMGQVVGVDVHADGGTVPTIAFAAPDGIRHEFSGLERDSTPWRVGEAVGVRYDPQQPRYAHADDALSRWWLPVALVVAAVILAVPHWLMRRKSAPSRPIFHLQPGERVRLSTQVMAGVGDQTSLRQLYVTDRRVVLGQVRILRLVVHLFVAVILATQLLSFIPAVPAVAYVPVAFGVILGEAYRFSRKAPIVQEHPLTSITRLSLTRPERWVRQGLMIAFIGGQDWTIYPAGKGGTTARPYADRISVVSGLPVEG